jgi:DNA primase
MSEGDIIEKVNSALDLERIISSQASDWQDQPASNARVGRCTHPVHGHLSDGDNAGNLIVIDGPEQGWHCYSHETSGDPLKWIAVEEGITSCRDPQPTGDDFVEALRAAADRAGVELQQDEADFEELPEKRKGELRLAEIIEDLHGELDTILGGRTIRRKLKDERGFSDADIDNAKIGWIDDQIYADLQRDYGNEALKRTGFQTDDGNQFVSGRIIYPYMKQGRPVYWTGRATEESAFEEAKYRKPRGDCPLEQPVHRIRPPNQAPTGPLWIVEGIQDAISTARAGGVKAATAVATNPSGQQRRDLFELARSADTVVVCFDSDDSGVSKSIDLALQLMSEGVHTQIAAVPEGDDPNDFFSNGGDFDAISPVDAVEKIVEERGDNNDTIERVLETVKPDTVRSDRIITKLADMTNVRVSTLRRMNRRQVREEHSSGWQEPEEIYKYGQADITHVLVYQDGTEIEIEDLGGRQAFNEFKKKYSSQFNFIPQLSAEEFEDHMNRWLDEIPVTQTPPTTPEQAAREVVMENIERSHAVVDRDNLNRAPEDSLAYNNGQEEVLVTRDRILEWLSDFDESRSELAKYLSPIKIGNYRRTVNGYRTRFWVFSGEAIRDRGYSLPEPSEVVVDEAEEDEEVTEEGDPL